MLMRSYGQRYVIAILHLLYCTMIVIKLAHETIHIFRSSYPFTTDILEYLSIFTVL